MKKLIAMMIGLSFTFGTLSVAQETKKADEDRVVRKGSKKKKNAGQAPKPKATEAPKS